MIKLLTWHEFLHGLLALPFAFYMLKKSKSFKIAFLVIVATYLMDADHLVDYFVYFGIKLNIADFFLYDYYYQPFALIPLHGWEYLVLMFVLYKFRYKQNALLAVIMGYSTHMFLDVVNIGSFLHYSILYRFFNNFIFT